MIIDNKTYWLSENNYIKEETIKKIIVLGNTQMIGINHFINRINRFNGSYNKTPAYTIDLHGNVYQHFEPIYCSNILSDIDLDKKSIVIMLENEGWLEKDVDKNLFINWIGDIYNRPDDVFEKKWRGYTYWAPYPDAQLKSAITLVNKLCDEFYIPKNVIEHNTMIKSVNDFSIIYRGNLGKHYTDLNPSWDFIKFKLEIDEK